MSRLADHQVKGFGVWDPEALNQFGKDAVADLAAAELRLSSQASSLDDFRRYRRALETRAKSPSLHHQLGISDDRYLSGHAPEYDGFREIPLSDKPIVSDVVKDEIVPFRIDTLESVEWVEELAIVRNDTTSWKMIDVKDLGEGGGTTSRTMQGAIITYLISFDSPTLINYVDFTSLVPLQLINVDLYKDGSVEVVEVEREISGRERVLFAPETVTRVEVRVNQPNRTYDDGFLHVFGLVDWQVGLREYSPRSTIAFPEIILDEDVFSAAIVRSDTGGSTIGGVRTRINGQYVRPLLDLSDDSLDEEYSTIFPVLDVAEDGASLVVEPAIARPDLIYEIAEDLLVLDSDKWNHEMPGRVTGNFRRSSTYNAEAHLFSERQKAYDVGRRLFVETDLWTHPSQPHRTPQVDEMWLRLRMKR